MEAGVKVSHAAPCEALARWFQAACGVLALRFPTASRSPGEAQAREAARRAEGVSAAHNKNMRQREITADLAARMPRVEPLRPLAPATRNKTRRNAADFSAAENRSAGARGYATPCLESQFP
jgi:hypothetical protein